MKIATIIDEMKNGKELTYIAGRFGGYMLGDTPIRADYARKAIDKMHIRGEIENGRMTYRAN